MQTASGLIDAIGRTPLIRLRRASESTGCEIFGKAEFMNPGGSVKDRAAREIVLDAERQGLLCRGARLLKVRQAIPASAWHMSAARVATKALLSCPTTSHRRSMRCWKPSGHRSIG